MQNKEILEALRDAKAEIQYPQYSFAVDPKQIDKVIGSAKDTLEVNNYIVKNVEIVFNTAQIVIVRSNVYTSAYGWESYDSALMLSCIKRVYKGEELIFGSTEE